MHFLHFESYEAEPGLTKLLIYLGRQLLLFLKNLSAFYNHIYRFYIFNII
jgi:hypothetical protein